MGEPAEPIPHAEALRQGLLHQNEVRGVECELEIQVVDNAESGLFAGYGVDHLGGYVRVEFFIEVVVFKCELNVIDGQGSAVVPLKTIPQSVGIFATIGASGPKSLK